MKKLIHAFLRFRSERKRPTQAINLRLLEERGETLEGITIRPATADDIPALAHVHVKAWNDTYWYVRKPPTYETREYQWKEQFKVDNESWFCFVVENSKGQLIGFATGKPYSSSELPDYAGELNKIYLLQEYQRLGIGRRLVGHVVREFLRRGIHSMVLFGEPSNPSIAFHTAMHGERLLAKNGDFDGGFAWDDLEKLAAICPPD